MIALDPNARTAVSLDRDKAVPEAERPQFVFRPLVGRDVRFYGRYRKRAESGSEDEASPLVYRMLALTCVGWKNVRAGGKEVAFPVVADWIPPGPDADGLVEARAAELSGWLEVLLTLEEARELLAKISLSDDDVKKSASQSGTGTGASAGAAAAPTA